MKPIHELSIAELEDYYVKAITEAEKAGKEWVEAKAEFCSIEDKTKPELARLMGLFEGSQASKEQQALCHGDWKNFLDLVSERRRGFLKAQVDFELSKLKIEAIRTIISTRREEVKNFRG